MCKIGDIIVIDQYISPDGKKMSKHSFVVIDDTPNRIKGLNYSFVSNVMSSFKNEEHRKKKLKYEENIEITSEEIESNDINHKTGYIKADQLYYFDKSRIKYCHLASVNPELMDELIRIIIKLEVENKLKQNLENLKIS